MPDPITVHVVRHGETDYNKEGRYVGRTDVPLNDTGREQVKTLAAELKQLGISSLTCSPLLRAKETATIIANELRLTRIYSDRTFIERQLGVYEGLTKQEAQEKYPDFYAQNITRLMDEAPPKGETPRQVIDRVFAGLDRLLSMSPPNVEHLIVTHGFVSKAIDGYFNEHKTAAEFFEHSLSNGEIRTYQKITRLEIIER